MEFIRQDTQYIRHRLDDAIGTVSSLTATVQNHITSPGHEQVVRQVQSLQRWRSWIMGAVAIIAAGVSLLVSMTNST